MTKERTTRYLVLDGGYLLDGLDPEKPRVLDHGEWIEGAPMGDLAREGKTVSLGKDEIQSLLSDWERVKTFFEEAGFGDLERALLLNADAEGTMSLLEGEKKALQSPGPVQEPPAGKRNQEPADPEGMKPGSVSLCRISGERVSVSVWASLSEGKLVVSGMDLFEEGQGPCGDDDYEYTLWLDEANTRKLHRALRADRPGTEELLDLLTETFSGEGAWVRFQGYCKEKNIDKEYFSI